MISHINPIYASGQHCPSNPHNLEEEITRFNAQRYKAEHDLAIAARQSTTSENMI